MLHTESKEGGHRDLPALTLFTDIHVSEVVDRFIPAPGDAMRTRDIVRAKIIKDDPVLKASTKEMCHWASYLRLAHNGGRCFLR